MHAPAHLSPASITSILTYSYRVSYFRLNISPYLLLLWQILSLLHPTISYIFKIICNCTLRVLCPRHWSAPTKSTNSLFDIFAHFVC